MARAIVSERRLGDRASERAAVAAGRPGDARSAIALWEALARRSPAAVFAIASTLAIVIGIVDRSVHEDVATSLFYIVPLALVSSVLGARAAVSFAAVSAFVWIWADVSGGHIYRQAWIPFWNASVRFSIFAIIGRLIVRVRGALEVERRLARTDWLTEVQNSRAFYEAAERERARAITRREPLTIAYLDIDQFKSINDTLGHLAGDGVLRAVALALRNAVRANDLVARLGGDEFAVLFVGTGQAEAAIVLGRVRDQILETMRANGWPITVSVGVLTYSVPPNSVEELVHRADELMYEVKRTGKDALRYAVVGAEEGIAGRPNRLPCR